MSFAALSAVLLFSLPLVASAETFTILHQFGATAVDGRDPEASLTLVGSTLYGTTYSGGTNLDYGTVFAINTNGSGYTILHAFAEYPDGANPKASLTLVGSTL